MRKREARAGRDALRRARQAEKSARLRERPTEEKTPRLGADPGSIFGMKMTWTVDTADRQDAWSWGTPRAWADETWTTVIEPKLAEWCNLTWAEIDQLATGNDGKRHKMHHSMPTEAIVDEAQYRLVEIDQYDDTMFRFRLGNLPRLWGFRMGAQFRIVWFDPNHEIYPTEP